jgi:hypothetical protein
LSSTPRPHAPAKTRLKRGFVFRQILQELLSAG